MREKPSYVTKCIVGDVLLSKLKGTTHRVIAISPNEIRFADGTYLTSYDFPGVNNYYEFFELYNPLFSVGDVVRTTYGKLAFVIHTGELLVLQEMGNTYLNWGVPESSVKLCYSSGI